MLVEDDVELAAAQCAQVAHVRPKVVELGATASRESAHRRELPSADVHEGRRGAELREEDRVPTASAGQRERALSFELDPFESAIRNPIEEPPLAGSGPRRRALRARVWDARLGEALPHALVVSGDLVYRDAFGHVEIVAA